MKAPFDHPAQQLVTEHLVIVREQATPTAVASSLYWFIFSSLMSDGESDMICSCVRVRDDGPTIANTFFPGFEGRGEITSFVCIGQWVGGISGSGGESTRGRLSLSLPHPPAGHCYGQLCKLL